MVKKRLVSGRCKFKSNKCLIKGVNGGISGISGQASIEFMIMLSILLVVLLAGIVFMNQQSDTAASQFKRTATRTALQEMSSAAKDVYYQGIGARRTVPVYFPGGVSAVYFQDNSIVAEFANGEKVIEYLGFNVSGNLTPDEGNAMVKLDSYGNYVYVQAVYGNWTQN